MLLAGAPQGCAPFSEVPAGAGPTFEALGGMGQARYWEDVQRFGIQTRSGNTRLTINNTDEWIFEHGTGRNRRTETEVLDKVSSPGCREKNWVPGVAFLLQYARVQEAR